MWAKASISLLSELAREAGEAQPVGNADRPHVHRPQSLDKDVVHAAALAAHADHDLVPFLKVPVKSPLVNWLPWSVLKISGRP